MYGGKEESRDWRWRRYLPSMCCQPVRHPFTDLQRRPDSAAIRWSISDMVLQHGVSARHCLPRADGMPARLGFPVGELLLRSSSR